MSLETAKKDNRVERQRNHYPSTDRQGRKSEQERSETVTIKIDKAAELGSLAGHIHILPCSYKGPAPMARDSLVNRGPPKLSSSGNRSKMTVWQYFKASQNILKNIFEAGNPDSVILGRERKSPCLGGVRKVMTQV